MYKWHIHSAIGRGKPIKNDVARVVDGIAASLRQFSISARSAANDGSPSIRTQKSNEALKEVSSFAPPSKGVDARSLAANPASSFPIRRVQLSFEDRNRSPGERGGFRGGSRGGLRGGLRGSPRGGGMRGGSRGRGGERGARKGKNDRTSKAKKDKEDDEDGRPEELTGKELFELFELEGGYPKPYNPETSMEVLARLGGPVITSPRGVSESVINRMRTATDSRTRWQNGKHFTNIQHGIGTFFENAEQRQVLEEYAQSIGHSHKWSSLSEAEKTALKNQWAAGHYKIPEEAEEGDILGQVRASVAKNVSYSPQHARSLEEKLRQLLPSERMRAKPGPVTNPL